MDSTQNAWYITMWLSPDENVCIHKSTFHTQSGTTEPVWNHMNFPQSFLSTPGSREACRNKAHCSRTEHTSPCRTGTSNLSAVDPEMCAIALSCPTSPDIFHDIVPTYYSPIQVEFLPSSNVLHLSSFAKYGSPIVHSPSLFWPLLLVETFHISTG